MVFPGITFKNNDIDYGHLVTEDNITYSLYIKEIYIFKYSDSENYTHNTYYNTNIRATYHVKPINNPDELSDKDIFVMVYSLHNDIKFNNNTIEIKVSNPAIHEAYTTKYPNNTGVFSFKLNHNAMNRFAKWLNKHY